MIVKQSVYYYLKERAERKMENEDYQISAIQLPDGTYVDVECYSFFVDNAMNTENELGKDGAPMCPDIYLKILAWRDGHELADMLGLDIITDQTMQFEQYRGQIIPLDGIYCAHCDAELYPPAEEYDNER